MLELLAARHVRISFSGLADIYCGASVKLQRLLEDLGAVYIDDDDRLESVLRAVYARSGLEPGGESGPDQLTLPYGVCDD